MGTSVTSTGITFPDSTTQTTAASGGFAAGTIMLFRQTAAPTGWTKDTTNYDGSAIRVVTGTVSSGGSVAFTTAFASQTPSGSVSVTVSAGTLAAAATTLSTTQMPSHSHSTNAQYPYSGSGYWGDNLSSWGTTATINATGGGGSHTHSMSGSPSVTASSFTGNAINLAVKYVDCIFATKN